LTQRAPVTLPTIIHRDDELIVVEKPSGLATTSPDGGDCLTARVRMIVPRAPHCHPSSRLDSPVTGVVIFALTGRAIERLLDARKDHAYSRRYVGLSGPTDTQDEETWTWPIAIDPRDKRSRVALELGSTRGERVQDAETRARVLARSAQATLWSFEPITGRTHQLRVHAAKRGAPLVGDTTYGGLRRVVLPRGDVLTCTRVALHCAVVAIPWRDGPRVFQSPLPEDLSKLAQGLGLPPLDLNALADTAREGAIPKPRAATEDAADVLPDLESDLT
jgi:tRNA pseudouridine32 synthase/23S rRNA pseudouridine746 synthase